MVIKFILSVSLTLHTNKWLLMQLYGMMSNMITRERLLGPLNLNFNECQSVEVSKIVKYIFLDFL